MNRSLLLLSVVALSLSAAACGSNSNNGGGSSANPPSSESTNPNTPPANGQTTPPANAPSTQPGGAPEQNPPPPPPSTNPNPNAPPPPGALAEAGLPLTLEPGPDGPRIVNASIFSYKLVPGEPAKIAVVGRYGYEDAAPVVSAAIEDYRELIGGVTEAMHGSRSR